MGLLILPSVGFVISGVDDGIPIFHFHKILYTFEYQFNTGLKFFKYWRRVIK